MHQAYLPICAYGKHSAILHHNLPFGIVDGNGLMLIDAAAEYTYSTDITRTFPVNGIFSDKQKLIYQMVLDIVLEIESEIRPGTSFTYFRTRSQELVTQHLLAADFIRGPYNELMARRIYSYFYPHGLGHSVGIDVHDPGSIENLRENMVLTIEPGIYFNEVLLREGFRENGPYLNIPKCQEYISENFGGVRIEDIIRITATGMKVMSYVPKTIAEIEQIMAKPVNAIYQIDK